MRPAAAMDSPVAPAASPPGWRLSAAALASLAAAALLADLGHLHALEHGDSLVPVLVSLQRWTPMYWDQERYGMLVPLLALPVRDWLANLMLQRGLLVLAGLASVPLLARYALPRRTWLLAGLLGAGSLLLLMPAPWLFEYLGDQPYGLSAALVLAGLIAAEPRAGRRGAARLGAAALLCLLGHWVNAAAGLFLAPVALARAAADRLEGEPGRAVRMQLLVDLGLIGLGLAAGRVSIWLYPVLTGYRLRLDIGTWPVSAWPDMLGKLLRNGVAGAGPAWPAALATAVAVGLLLPWRGDPPRGTLGPTEPPARSGPGSSAWACGGWPRALVASPRARTAFRALLLCAAALAYALVTASLRWVSANELHWRYLAPPLLLVHLAGLSFLAEPVWRSRRALRPALLVALLLVPAAALAAYGPPSLARVRADLDAKLGTWTEDVLAARCDLVAGDYWSVWPAVWHAGWVARRRGVTGPYGITHRTNATARFWKGRPPAALRICRVRGAEAQSEYWLRAFHLWPARTIEERRTVEVAVPDDGARP